MALPSSPRRAASVAGALAACSLALLAGCSSSERSVTTDAAPTTIDIAENPQGGTFRLLTYNVDGLPVEISTGHPDRNLPLISPLLNDDDLVLTQEDYDWWKPGGLASTVDFVNYHGRLRAETDQEHRTGKHPGPDAVGLDTTARPAPELGDGLGVLSNFPIANTERVPWTNCFGGFDQSDHGAADCLAMKGFLVTTVTLDGENEVDVYDLHGEAGGSAKDQELQADDFEQLAAYIDAHSKGRAVIVAGDTNLHTDRVHPDSAKGADIGIWKRFLDATGLTDSCAATSCPDTGRIDKVAFRSAGGVTLEATSRKVEASRFVDAKGEDLSDHQAVSVRFRWKAA